MEKLLTQSEAANYLGISSASITNWIKHGYLKKVNNCYHLDELINLKNKINNGEIPRLNSRANKSRSKDRFIPNEYISNKDNIIIIDEIVNFIIKNKININHAIFLLALNLFKKSGDFLIDNSEILSNFNINSFRRESVFKHLSNWKKNLSIELSKFEIEAQLIEFNLPDEKDILGIIYQSLLHEGDKSGLGSYYTPYDLVKNLVDRNIRSDYVVLDPCCGTGQFLIAFSETIGNPLNIYGFDIDPIAINIAATNLMLFYNNIDFLPNVFCIDFLKLKFDINSNKENEYFEKFDLIATNPPWGASYDKTTLNEIENNFRNIKSKESFSYFICQSYNLLKNNGLMAFVLPESITNVKTHQDIRDFILNHLTINKISILGKKFKKVLSSVITIEMTKSIINENSLLKIQYNGDQYNINPYRFKSNKSYLFDIYINEFDDSIFNKIYKREHITLTNNADWALGIVTGDNNKFISAKKINENYEPIYKGSDINMFLLKKPNSFIQYTPDLFQQVAPTELYRAKEKLIYKFISSNLVFAYDNKQSLTLNSANILIPRIKNYPIKLILAIFNSELFNFFYKKKFNTIKILRGDIEQVPLPLMTDREKNELIELMDSIINNKNENDIINLNNYLYSYYKLTNDEIVYIRNYLKKYFKNTCLSV